jgi:hypothetical protein
MLAVESLPTVKVVAVNVAVLPPTGIVTEAGTVTKAESELRLTVVATGAVPVSVTVPIALSGPVTVAGANETRDRIGGRTLSLALKDLAPLVAVTVAVAAVVTAGGVIVKVALDVPDATVTLAGTGARIGLEETSETGMPPVGAAPVKVTVPVAGAPP